VAFAKGGCPENRIGKEGKWVKKRDRNSVGKFAGPLARGAAAKEKCVK